MLIKRGINFKFNLKIIAVTINKSQTNALDSYNKNFSPSETAKYLLFQLFTSS